MKRFVSLVVVLAAGAAFVFAPGAASASHARAASALPALNISLAGTSGISLSSSSVPSGATSVHVTFSGKAPKGGGGPIWGIARVNPGASLAQAFAAIQAAHGDLNALQGLGMIIASGSPGTFQVNLTPSDSYIALNESGNGNPGVAPFQVTQSSSPATLPAPGATISSIDFGFRGPNKLHNGELVRFQNKGYLVHMNVFFRVKNKKVAKQVIALLKAGKGNKAQKLAVGGGTFQGPVSPGGLQQQVISAKRGVYVEACFMNAQDGREHTQLGMERMFTITK